MLFSKDFLLEGIDGKDVMCDNYIDHTRWSIVSRRVFRHDNKYYETIYSQGATEQQDESPYEYEGDMIECPEVEQVQTTATIYRKKV